MAPSAPDPDRYDHAYRHCDILIVGAGPAGLTAATAAARSGLDVVLMEQAPEVAGALLWDERTIDAKPARRWAEARHAELSGLANVEVMTRTSAAGYYDHNLVLAIERRAPRSSGAVLERLWHVRAGQVVITTGALERPMVFPGNDRPGVMLASAVREYLGRYRVLAGSVAVLYVNNDDAYRTAGVLRAFGVKVAAIVDSRLDAGAGVSGVPLYAGSVIAGTRGGRRISSVTIRSRDGRRTRRVTCDLVATSGGWNPAVQLFCHSGGALRFDARTGAFMPDRPLQPTLIAGAAAGAFTLEQCLDTGWRAGSAAAQALGRRSASAEAWRVEGPETDRIEPFWRTPAELAMRGEQWIDFHNDVAVRDIELAARENLHSVEHLKRYTTLGMAPDQGKTSNVNGLAVLAEATDRTPGEVGTTTFRPPYTPIKFGVIAGRERGELFRPMRLLPTHEIQTSLGAQMDDYGPWLRPAFYARDGEAMRCAIEREVEAVRTRVGILDYSPLGKLEVSGRDAAEFLDRMVAASVRDLGPESVRYSLTLSETGAVTDDGVIARLSDGAFLVGTTSGAAGRIHVLFEEWRQCEWPQLEVSISNVTAQWGVILLTGPRARAVLSGLGLAIDLSPSAFPHMTVRETELECVPLRISRVSFTGEISFEIAVPRGFAAALWRRLMELGSDLGIAPVGLEALDVLRIEKGFIHLASDSDGLMTPADFGYGGILRGKTVDFLGKRSLALPGLNGPGRLQLVGLQPRDGAELLPVGAQVVRGSTGPQASGEGVVTSSVWSPTLGRPIALGLLAEGRRRMGEGLHAYHDHRFRPVEVVSPRFYDPKGARLDG